MGGREGEGDRGKEGISVGGEVEMGRRRGWCFVEREQGPEEWRAGAE
jgi:hypothetical protein